MGIINVKGGSAMEKVLMIMNPYSGKRQAVPHLCGILETFCKNGYRTTVEMTTQKGDGARLAAELADQYDRIVCIGGDGTLNEVVNGVLSAGSSTPIAYIPAGSTNDFATSLNIPKNIMQAAEAVTRAKPTKLDAGLFGDRYFTYVASFGAFTKTSFSASQNLKNTLGHFAYFLEGIKDITTIKPYHMRFELDTGVFEDDYVFGAVSNATSVGGIVSFDPEKVCMNDGLFEIFLVKYPKTIQELNSIIEAILSQKYDSDSIVFSTASMGLVYSPKNVDWTVDGEMVPTRDVCSIQNIHNAINYLL